MKEVNEKIFNDDDAEIITVYPDKEMNKEFEIKFWYRDRDKIKIEQRLFIEFLGHLGIKKYFSGKEFSIVEVANNIVREVESVHIKDKVMNYFNELDEELEEGITKSIICNKIIAMAPTLFSKSYLEFLPILEGEFKRDKYKESFLFFKNCFVKVTKDKYETYDYCELEGLIWDNQIIQREFYKTDKESEVIKLCLNICKNNLERYYALISAMGYLMHGYRNPTQAKAIIFMDEKISDGSNGGSGKSLIGLAISHVRNSLRLGKNFKFDRFSFQSYEQGTSIIEFNDIHKNFPFEMLFTSITENIAIEKKNKNEIIIPFNNAPKILISTNHTIKGVDESTLRRQFIIEFSDHYNMKFTPEDEFRKRFFDDWNNAEWNEFYNFMIGCIQYHLSNGLVDYTRVNLEIKKQIENTSEEFIEFIEEVELDQRYDKKILHQKFIETYTDFKNLHQKTFTSWIKTYAKLNGLNFEVKNSGNSKGFILTKEKE